MPWRLQAWSNFFSVSVCVCPLMSFVFVRDRQFEFVGHIYRWRNRTRRASIVSQWFLVLPCHVSTDWSSPKLMRAAQRPSWWFVTSSSAKICSTDSRKVGLIQLIPSDVIGSNHLSVAVLEALWSLAQSRAHRVLQETCHKWIYMSQKAILQATYVHLLMNGEMMKWWTHMNASSLHFPMNTRRSFEAHNLSEAFARPFQLLFFCWKFMKVLFRCPLNILNLKVLQKRCLNLLGSRGAGCALVFRRLDCSGCVQFCALNLPGWSCLTWQEIDIWII